MTVRNRAAAAAAVSDHEGIRHRILVRAVRPAGSDGGESWTDTESGGSSSAEEVESPSPRSVARWRMRPRTKDANVHSQVLRVREEDSYLGEDIIVIGDGLSLNWKDVIYCRAITAGGASHVPVLPSSPLRHPVTTTIKTVL